MNNRYDNGAIRILQHVVNPGDFNFLSSVQWKIVLPQLREHRLTAFVYARLRRSSAWPVLPADIRNALSQDFQQITIRAYRMDAELGAVVQALADAGVPVLLLKGAALGRTIYGSSAERPVSDFDLLVPREAVQTAWRALQVRGYQAAGLYWLVQQQQRYRAELPLLRTEEDGFRLMVELHWTLLEAPFYMDHIPTAEMWQDAQPVPDLPGALTPAPATLLVHACAHLALHHSDDQRWFWLLDVDQLARWPMLDWQQVMAQAERWRLDLAVATVLQQTAALFATPLPASVQEWLTRPRRDQAQVSLLKFGPRQRGRTLLKIRHTWQNANRQQRGSYVAWLALRSLLWLPEQYQRQAIARSSAFDGVSEPSVLV